MHRNARQLIIDTFISMMQDMTLSQIRITNIIDALNIHRNTFYYHFSNKYEISLTILFEDLDRELQKVLPSSELLFTTIGQSKTEYAYYTHVEIGARTLDSSSFFKAMTRCLLDNRTFYTKLFNPSDYEFAQYLSNLYLPAFQEDIRFMLGGRYMPDETRDLLASACVACLLSACNTCLHSPQGEELLDSKVNPFWNIIHDSLYSAIQAHPMNSRLRP